MVTVRSPEEQESKLNQTRQDIFEASKFDPTHQRYGLFSFTGTLAIGDDSICQKQKHPRGEQGEVVTELRNFMTTRTKKGKSPDVYFERPKVYSTGDPYIDPFKMQQMMEKRSKRQAQGADDTPAFKPAGPYSNGFVPYNYEGPGVEKKHSRKNSENSVILEPKNFLTSPPKKGAPDRTPNLLFGSFKATSGEPYDRQKELNRSMMERGRKKIVGDRAFRSMDYGEKEFFSVPETFGPIDMPPKKPAVRQSSSPVAQHDRPFRPANPAKTASAEMTLGKFPQYIPNPTRKQSPSRSPGPGWKTTYKGLSRPTPSVATNMMNLKSEYSVLRRCLK